MAARQTVAVPDIKKISAGSSSDECAGVGGRKKRMPLCNEVDMGSSFARCESRLTSDWSPFARNLNEPTRERKQMEATSVSLCALRCGNRHSDSIAKLILIDQRVVPKGLAFGRLEPYEV